MKRLNIGVNRVACVLFASLFCITTWANERVFVVKPEAGIEGIHSALKAARVLRKNSPNASGPIRIVLQSGEYIAANGPLRITHEDSGTADSPTIIESQVQSGAVIVGAAAMRPVSGRDGVQWTFRPHDVPGSTQERTAGQFFVNGQRAVLARHPNKGRYFFVDRPKPADNYQEASKATFSLTAADAQALAAMTEGQQDRALLTVMQSWSTGNHRLASVHPSGQVTVSPSARWPFLNFGHSQRLFVKNTSKALDDAGEWIAAGGAIRYMRRQSDTYEKSEARWPRVSSLITVTGNPAQGLMVEHVQILGVALAYTGEITPVAGWVGRQAAADIDAAVIVDGARNFALSNCSISRTGGYGVWLRRAVQQSTVSSCKMTDLGAGGVKVGEPNLTDAIFRTEKNTLQGNQISWTGQEFPDAVGIWVGHSSGNSITRNFIHNTSYTGISVGWQWGYAESSARQNNISNNVLLDIGSGQLSDLGAIYTLGRSPRTVISGNFIRNVTAYPGYGPGAWGIYNDEGASDIKVANNVVMETSSGGYHLHYGENVSVENNLFAKGQASEVRWTAPSRSGILNLTNNGIISSQERWLEIRGPVQKLISSGNTISTTHQAKIGLVGGPSATDVVISGGTPEQSKAWAATVGNARAVAGNRNISGPLYSVVKAEKDAWRVHLDEIAVGGRPIDVMHSPKSPTEALSVVKDGAGSKALRLQDGLTGMARYDPHFYFPVSVDSDGWVSRFTVLPDANTELIHEWRDADYAFNTGPKVQIAGSRLMVANSVVATLPTGTWVEIEVRQDLSDTNGNWTLRWRRTTPQIGNWVALGPYAPTSKQVPRRWRWVGWYANGTTASSTLLKNIEFRRAGALDSRKETVP